MMLMWRGKDVDKDFWSKEALNKIGRRERYVKFVEYLWSTNWHIEILCSFVFVPIISMSFDISFILLKIRI